MEYMRTYSPGLVEEIWNNCWFTEQIEADGLSKEKFCTEVEKAIEGHQYGQAGINTTVNGRDRGIHLAWYSFRRHKHIGWGYNGKEHNGAVVIMDIPNAVMYKAYIKEEAAKELFPERLTKYKDLKCRREMAQNGVSPSKRISIDHIIEYNCGIYLVETASKARHICTPAGNRRVVYHTETVRHGLIRLGINIGQLRNPVWKDIEPMWRKTVQGKSEKEDAI